MHFVHMTAMAATLAVVLVACGSVPPPSNAPAPSAPVDPGPAIDTNALMASAAAKDGQLVHVTGFVLITDQVRLCSVVLESYPPQCGGATVNLTGEVPADVVAALDKTTEPGLAQASWGWVDVTGTFTVAGGPAIQISEIRVVER
jgi:hypothetical protein